MSRNPELSMARVRGDLRKNGQTPADIPDGYIEWEEHYLAWNEYMRRHPNPKTAEEIEREGGFTYSELKRFLRRPPYTWVLGDPVRYGNFVRDPKDMPGPDPDAPPAPIPYSHIWYLGQTVTICEDPQDEIPRMPILFDNIEEAPCPKCEKRILAWYEWWKTYEKGVEKDG